MKVATYCRISTDEERQPYSLDAQAERLSAYIFSQNGWRMVRTYTDQTSGKTLDRPGLEQALREAKARTYDLLLVFKVDRLARSMSGLTHILEELNRAGVAFRSASEPFDTATAAGRMMAHMLGVFAEFEREMIVERTKMGLAKKAARGEWTGGIPPFGYRYDAERRLLVPADDEAAVVRTIFERYAERGEGSMTIAKWLNERSERTRRALCWTPGRVISLLKNPTYLGLLPFGGQLHEAGHEPLVTRELFERAAALLKKRGATHSLRRSNPTDYLLTSFLRCSRCGHGFIGTVAHGRSTTYRYYTCYSRHRHGTSICDQDRLPADRLEEIVIKALLAELDDGRIFEEAAERALRDWEVANSGRTEDIGRLEKKINERRKALDRLLRAFESGQLSESICGYRAKEVEKELTVLEADKATLEAAAERPGFESVLKDLGAELERALEQGTPQEVKQLIAAVVDSIVVESRSFVQPYYFLSTVRLVCNPRRRTGIEPASELSPAHWC